MATIQVRDLPEPVYEIIHRRARAAGQSIQAYMREQIVLLAATPTDEDLFARADGLLAAGSRSVDIDALLHDRDADRR